jgi:hypothetical protein
LEHGVIGYLHITYAPDSLGALSVSRGGEISINMFLHLVSYSPDLAEVQAVIDPKNPYVGLRAGRGHIWFNDLVGYNPSGNLTIEAGETVPIEMTIRIPEDLPSYVESIRLEAWGIGAWKTVKGGFALLDELAREWVVLTIDG